jgi:hypothetical protein
MMDKNKKKPVPRSSSGGSKKNPRRRKVLIWCAAVLGALFLLLLLVAWLIFSGYRQYPAPKLGEKHYLLLRRIATDLRVNRDREEASLRFTAVEMALLLDIIRHSSQFVPHREMVPQPENFMLEYKADGGLRAVAPIPVAGKWCFGGNIYVSGVLYLEKFENKVDAEVEDLRFGRFDMRLPVSVDTLVPGWRERLSAELSQDHMRAIKGIRAERDGTLVLTYRPQELRKPLKRQLTRLRKNCSGELKMPLNELIKAL